MTEPDTVFDALLADRAEAYKRLRQVEQLCRDMYETMHYLDPRHVYGYYTNRMDALGLLEVDNDS